MKNPTWQNPGQLFVAQVLYLTFNKLSCGFKGYLAKSDGSTSLVWEHNENQGAWGSEGRIQLFRSLPKQWNVRVTAGVGNMCGRINCNQFIQDIRTNYGYVEGATQDIAAILRNIPYEYKADFNTGLTL